MEKFLPLLICAFVGVLAVRMLLLPLALAWKLGIHAGCGFLCLWLLNLVSGITGIFFPVNAVTVVIAGFLGLPGVGLLALLEWLG